MFSRIGAAAAPFVVDMLSPFWHQLPVIIMVGACVFAALCLAAVPETNLQALPDTFTDAHRLRQSDLDLAKASKTEEIAFQYIANPKAQDAKEKARVRD